MLWEGNHGEPTNRLSGLIRLDELKVGLEVKNSRFIGNDMNINSILNVNNPVDYIKFHNCTFENESKLPPNLQACFQATST